MDKNKIIQAATKFVQKGQFDKAIKEYQRIIEDDPRDIRVLLKIGELHQKRGDNKEAASTLLRVAEAYSNDGFFLKAAAVYKQVLKLNPALLDVNLRLAELYQQLGLMSDAMQQYQLVANNYEKQGNAKASLNLLKKLVELEPDNAASRVRLAEAFSNEGMTAEAIVELGKVAEQLKQSARNDEFVKVAERLLFLDPTNISLTRELANIYLGKGDTKRALAKLQICFKSDPQDIDTLILLAQTFLDLGQQPKTVSVYKELAKIYAERGRQEEELATWRRVLTLVPDDSDALMATGQSVEADELVEEDLAPEPIVAAPPPPVRRPMVTAVARPSEGRGDPRAADVQKLLAETDVYLKYGLHEKAGDHLRRILLAAPNSLPAHQKAKELHLLTGDSAAAAEELLLCVRISLKDDNLPQAKVFLDQARELSPHHPALAELQHAMGGVVDLPELGADEAILVEATSDDAEVLEADALLEDSSQQFLVDEPSVGSDFGDDEALIVADDPVGDGASLGDEALLVAGDEPLDSAAGSSLIDEPLVDDSSEMGHAALAAVGFDPAPEVVAELVSEPDELLAIASPEPGQDTPEALLTRAPTPAPEPARHRDEATAARVRAPSEPGREPSKTVPAVSSAAPRRSNGSGSVIIPAAPAPSASTRSPVSSAQTLVPEPSPAVPPRSDVVSAPAAPISSRPPVTVTRSAVTAVPLPVSPAAPEPVDEPSELDEAEFFLAQGLLDEAEEAIATLRSLAAAQHPAVSAKVDALEQRLSELRNPPAESASTRNEAGFDLAAELDHEVAAQDISASEDDFQYPVADVISEFKKGLERVLGPEEVEGHYEMGIAFREMGLVDEAVAEFDVALKGAVGTPREADCLSMIGICQSAKGDFAKAAAAFEGALRSKSLKPEGRLNLYFEIGAAREASGNFAGALDAYEKVAKVDPNYRDVGAALGRVRAGKTAVNGHAETPEPAEAELGADSEEAAEPTLIGGEARSRKIGYV